MWQQWLQNPIRLGLITASLAGFFGLLAYVGSSAFKPDLSLLFSQVDPADGGRIIERLQAKNIPFEVQNGTDIYVAGNEVARVRMELAEEGLPSGGVVGYEIFDKNDMLGTTTAMMDIQHLRALEGELSKSIKTIHGVHSARVHLVLPKRELFSQTRTEASASVLLHMKTAARLSSGQAQSIQHLIAASVPSLLVERISIVDDRGNLLARGRDHEMGDVGGRRQEMQSQNEERLSRAIEGMLERTLGTNKARVEVHLEMDFDQITTATTDYDPDRQVARSTSSHNETSASKEVNANDTVSVQNALPDQVDTGAGTGSGASQNQNQDENIQYEITTIQKTHIKEPGSIKKISVAVLVDGTSKKNQNGEAEYTPRSKEELEQIATLVKTAAGFDADRGDVVEVVNMPFSEEPIPEEAALSMTQKISAYINIRKTLEIILLGFFALLVGIMVVRPIINTLTTTPLKGYADASAISINEDGSPSNLPETTNQPQQTPEEIPQEVGTLSERTHKVITDKPDEAVNVLRGWIEGGS